jgi:aminoglycoside phosphotransferase (APT) family kinase protein
MHNEWLDNATSIRVGEELDERELMAFLGKHFPNIEDKMAIEQFPKGFSNLTYLVRLGERQFVLRRPPFGAKIKTAHDMAREYKILSCLKPFYAKAPRPLLYCDDENIIGAPFYLMQRVEGVILRPQMPEAMIPTTQKMARIADAFVDSLVELHAIDYEAAGLADLGRPHGYVQRQIEGWTKRYQKAHTEEIPEMAKVAAWLAKNLPKESGAALIHNDFKYDNIVLDPKDRTQVIAVLDWEMATLGEPLMDLGTTLGYWIDPDDPPEMQALALSPTTCPGNPTRAELAEKYAKKSGKDVGHLVFYYVYGLFKVAVIVQQIYYRYKLGHTKDSRFARLIDGVKACSRAAAQAIAKNKTDHLYS